MLKTLCAFTLGLFVATLAQAAAPNCEPEPQLKFERLSERVILVGETHGNEQAPAFVTRLICGLLAQGRQVALAVERSMTEQPALDRYLASTGGAGDVRALLSMGDWAAATQDGRSSAAMLKLLDQLRRWRQAGQPVELLAIVKPWQPDAALPFDPKVAQAAGDLAMADNISTALAWDPNYVIVVLAGTFHTAIGSKMHQDIIGSPSMGDVLAARLPVHAIGLSSGAGESWICHQAGDCGARRLMASPWNLPDARVDTPVELGPVMASGPASRAP